MISRGLCVCILLCAWVTAATASDQPNVVLIMADDVAYDCFGCYGSDFFSTPRLDEMAAQGVQFDRCYSTPVCTPSRVKIMTGRSGVRNYTIFGALDPKETTFGTMMKEAGYATAIAGKWQLHAGDAGSLPTDCDFDAWCLWNYPEGGRSRYWKPALNRNGKFVEVEEDTYGPDLCADFLIEFARKNKDRPFFLYYPMILVHSPYPPTPHSVDRQSKDNLKNFRDMVAYMDHNVGRIVDSLEDLGLREKTVILFTTDNGTGRSLKYPYQGEQRVGEKAWPTEGGTHEPLIVNCPGTVPEGLHCDDLVDFSDFMPTIAEITGAALPDVELDGRSFWPQCLAKQGNPREWIYQFYRPKNAEVAKTLGREIIWAHDKRYKLYSTGRLYDFQQDRSESNPIPPNHGSAQAESARLKLGAAIDSMPAPKGAR